MLEAGGNPDGKPTASKAAQPAGTLITQQSWLREESRTSHHIAHLALYIGNSHWLFHCLQRSVSGVCGEEVYRETDKMMELKIQLVPTGEIILSPGKNGESYCNCCAKVEALC
ncbi:myosin Ic, paralog b isoform X1 [Tachysurus ichikawai]